MPLTKENVSRFPSLSIVLFAYLYDEWLLQQEMEKQQRVHIVNQTHTSLATVTIAQCADTYFCQGKENFDWLFSSMRGVVKLKM